MKVGDSKRSAVPWKGESLGRAAAHGRAARHVDGLEGANRKFATGSRIPLSPSRKKISRSFYIVKLCKNKAVNWGFEPLISGRYLTDNYNESCSSGKDNKKLKGFLFF